MSALGQSDFLFRTTVRVVFESEPALGAESEGVGVDGAVVAEAVEGCAEEGAGREELAFDCCATGADFAGEVGWGWRRHAEGFVDEGSHVFAVVQTEAAGDIGSGRES